VAKMKEIICACGCGRKKMVRVADLKRGWGKYYSKSCKAKAQVKNIGSHVSKYDLGGGEWDYESEYLDGLHPFSSEGLGQD